MPYLDWMGNTIGTLGSPNIGRGIAPGLGRLPTLGNIGAGPGGSNTFANRWGDWEPALSPAGLPAFRPAMPPQLIAPDMGDEGAPVPDVPYQQGRYEELNT